jgi:hypothetical protein
MLNIIWHFRRFVKYFFAGVFAAFPAHIGESNANIRAEREYVRIPGY